ncbi:hypothetical protein ARMGADRAFT_78655 [Armillaria gallica]|uniref:Uncharacterized protein n=1 Tax=Armillaria gallica TaxID=47427 RepID=A0A2H3CWH7_ARMGA|nr:hypothetical protein ARMGADRAFT_78655 [Armillaria gallica]
MSPYMMSSNARPPSFYAPDAPAAPVNDPYIGIFPPGSYTRTHNQGNTGDTQEGSPGSEPLLEHKPGVDPKAAKAPFKLICCLHPCKMVVLSSEMTAHLRKCHPSLKRGRDHKGKPTTVCPLDGHSVREKNFTRHVLDFHYKDHSSLVCPMCGAVASCRKYLEYHMQSHLM